MHQGTFLCRITLGHKLPHCVALHQGTGYPRCVAVHQDTGYHRCVAVHPVTGYPRLSQYTRSQATLAVSQCIQELFSLTYVNRLQSFPVLRSDSFYFL